jgi:hypothetical protein
MQVLRQGSGREEESAQLVGNRQCRPGPRQNGGLYAGVRCWTSLTPEEMSWRHKIQHLPDFIRAKNIQRCQYCCKNERSGEKGLPVVFDEIQETQRAAHSFTFHWHHTPSTKSARFLLRRLLLRGPMRMGCEEAVYEADLVGDKESECQAD